MFFCCIKNCETNIWTSERYLGIIHQLFSDHPLWCWKHILQPNDDWPTSHGVSTNGWFHQWCPRPWDVEFSNKKWPGVTIFHSRTFFRWVEYDILLKNMISFHVIGIYFWILDIFLTGMNMISIDIFFI